METSDYYDRFWRGARVETWDPRALERAHLAFRLLTKRGGTLLDIGCGRGVAAGFFRDRGFQVKGLDISPEAVRITSERGIEAEMFNITQDELEGKYDVITCFEVLEHVVDPLGALVKMKRVLKNSGEMVISLPNDFHLLRRFQILFEIGRFAGYDWPHVRFFNPREAYRLLKDAGLRVGGRLCVPLAPPRRRVLSRINYYLAQVWPGLLSYAYIFRLTQ